MPLQNISIIIFSILLSSSAHVALKKGMLSFAASQTGNAVVLSLLDKIWAVGTNPWVMGGMALHVSALVVWLVALARVDISFAYPFLSLGYVVVGVMAYYWLGERVEPQRLIGMAIIITGIIVLARAG